jgi:hypothetical protein
VRIGIVLLALPGALAILCCSPSAACAGSSALEYLEGGTLSCRTEAALGFLYGAGARPDGLGTPVSTLRAGAASATGNAAGLAFLESNALVLDVIPGLGAPVSDILNAEGRAASAVDDAIEDIATEDIDLSYPSVDAWAGQQSGVLSGLAAFRFGPVTAAAAFEEPLALDLSVVDTGIEALGEAIKNDGGGEVNIVARCFLDAAGEISVAVSRSTLAAASRPAPSLGVGVSISRYTANARVVGTVRGDGIVDYGGQVYAFNDPSDPWHNELGASADGAFEGSGLGWTAGVSWRPRRWIALDAVYCRAPELRLDGEITTIENTIPAVDEDGVSVDQISADQPTLTQETVTVHDDPLLIELPSYAGAALSARAGVLLATVEYRMYVDSIGFTYGDYSEGVDLKYGVGVELDVGGLWAGGGVVRGTLRTDPDDPGAGDAVAIPFANVGFGVGLGPGIELDTLILAVPVQVLRLSVSYEF